MTASTDNNPERSIDEDGIALLALEELPKGRGPVASCAVGRGVRNDEAGEAIASPLFGYYYRPLIMHCMLLNTSVYF